MFRDPTKLRVFGLADDLALEVCCLTRSFPPEERNGLGSPLRRAALSAPLRIMEGCRLGGDEAFRNGLNSAIGAAAEARYLTTLAERLGLFPEPRGREIQDRFLHLTKALYGLKKAGTAGNGATGRGREDTDPEDSGGGALAAS